MDPSLRLARPLLASLMLLVVACGAPQAATVSRVLLHPEFFFAVLLADVESFVARYDGIQNRDDYERFTARFGIRRTNPAFWGIADWFNAQALREQPERAGIFDLNRYQNR